MYADKQYSYLSRATKYDFYIFILTYFSLQKTIKSFGHFGLSGFGHLVVAIKIL
jgi:hypothetical protein